MNTTVIVICYNWPHFLKECLESIFAQIIPVKILVMTDGSDSRVIEICGNLSVPFLSLPDFKNNITRINFAVMAVDTPYYMLLCVDDLLVPNYIELAEKEMRDNIDIVCADIEKFGEVSCIWKSSGFTNTIKIGNSVFFSSLVRKTLWEKLGGYDENIPYSYLEDWDFWVRAYYSGAQCIHIPQPLYKYRVHPQQISRTIDSSKSGEAMRYLADKWRAY